jgi:thioredoxin reductase (NADPH)
MSKREVIVVGSGPAGLTAAIYSGRADLKPFIIEGFQAGGQLMNTTDVENFPGFAQGITGPELMENLRKQALRFGAEFLSENVTRVDFAGKDKLVWVEEDRYAARTVIISTGAKANYLGLKNELRLRGRGVSACATCDGFFFRDKTICVIGGGDSAMEEALFLTKFASKVFIIHRRGELRASKIMAQRARKNSKIEFILHTVVKDVLGKDRVEGVLLHNRQSGKERELKVEGMFLGIGHTPNTDLFRNQLDIDENGYIVTTHRRDLMTQTSVEGVFACGDVQDSRYQQAITAAGSGCMAAMDAERYLENLE